MDRNQHRHHRQPDMDEAIRALYEITRPILTAYQQAFENLANTLKQAGIIKTPPPADPRQRSLYLRQHRNTGPGTPIQNQKRTRT